MGLGKTESPTEAQRESIDSILATNLMVARLAAGISQQELAKLADVSRATIWQIETGCSDPRLSTIVELARALEVSPIVLLSGLHEVSALSRLAERTQEEKFALNDDERDRVRRMVGSGMVKDRLRAARVAVSAVRNRGDFDESAVVVAAIFSVIIPSIGTRIGAILGDLLSEPCAPEAP